EDRPAQPALRIGVLIVSLAALMITVVFGSPRGLLNYYDGARLAVELLDPERRGRWAFLRGKYSKTGFWYYFLLAQLWKTPISALIFFCWSLFLIGRERTQRLTWLFILLPIAAFHAAGLSSNVNVGL